MLKRWKKMEKETIEITPAKILQRIIKKRQELGLSQMDLAFKLHLTANGYFKGSSPKVVEFHGSFLIVVFMQKL